MDGQERQTERRKQAQKLEALGHFAGGIAHDFNNILSIIEGQAHIAMRDLRTGQLTEAQLRKITDMTQRGAGITRQLLAFARQKVDTGGKTNLRLFLEQQQSILHLVLGEAVEVQLELPDDKLWVRATGDQIMQVIMNLALNARDAMEAGGIFTVACKQVMRGGKTFAALLVSDTGSGIPPDVLPHIFEPFFSTKTADKGSGLGLSVVYGIIDQLGGHVDVSSVPGKGALFDILLPVTAAGTEKTDAWVDNETYSLAGKTILVAEDEPELKDILAVLLGDMDMRVITASNGNHALKMLEDHQGVIDFLLTDIVMPEVDGVRLGALFGDKYPDANVVYMSGYPFLDGGRNFNLPPNADFIDKPLREEKLRQVLERALERKMAREKAEREP